MVPVDGRRRGGMGACSARMLVGVCAVPVVPCVLCRYCARWMVCRRGGGSVLVCHGVGSHGW